MNTSSISFTYRIHYSYFALIFALFKMISTLNGGMNNDSVYLFLDPESDTIFCTYCFSSNFLNLDMFLFFSKTILNGILFKIYQSPNLFHLDICKLNTTRNNNKKKLWYAFHNLSNNQNIKKLMKVLILCCHSCFRSWG